MASGGFLDVHGYSPVAGALNGGGLIDNLAAGSVTLTIGNGGGSGTFSGTIRNTAGAIALVKAGSGIQVLSGPNTYAGTTTINAGTLQSANSGALGATSSVAVNNAGSMLAVNYGGLSDYTQAGVAALLGNTTFSATTTAFGFDTTNAASPATYGNGLSMAAGLTKLGTGTLILTQSNTYAGSTTINAGMLQLGSASALPAATTLTVNGGTLNLNGNNNTITSFGGGSGTSVITDYSASSGTTTLTATNDTSGLNSLVTDGPSQKVALVLKNNLDSAGGGGTLNNNGNAFSGGLTLSGAGSTGLRYGVGSPTQVGTPGNLTSSPFGRGPITLGLSTSDKVQLWFSGDNNVNFMSAIVFNSAVGTDTVGAVRIDATGVTLSGTLTAGLTDVNIEGGQDTTTNWSGSLTGQVTGVNGLDLLPPGGTGKTFTLTLANTTANPDNYQGNTTVNAGNVLLLGASGQIPNGPGTGNMSLSGSFNLGGFNATVNGLFGAGLVDGASGTPTLTVGGNNQNVHVQRRHQEHCRQPDPGQDRRGHIHA